MTRGLDQNAFIDLLYEAVIEPDLWTKVLEGLGDQIGGGPAILTTVDRDTGAGTVLTARVGSTTVNDYLSHYAARNPLLSASRHAGYEDQWSQRVVVDEQVVDRACFEASEYYNDFLRPIGAEWKMIFRLNLKDKDLSALVVARPQGKGRFGEEAVAKANVISPHLIRAFALSRKLAITNAFSDDPTQSMEMSPKGLLVLDEDGIVRHSNSRAETAMTRNASLSLRAGRLVCVDPEENGRLAALVTAARDQDPGLRRGGSIRLRGRNGSSSILISVSPLRSDRAAGFIAAGAAVMVCIEPSQDSGFGERRLKEVYAFTAAESRVAMALHQGLRPAEIAARLDVSVNTVRAQLNSAFVKSGAHRQAELVRRITMALES